MIVRFISRYRTREWTDVEHLEVDRSRPTDRVRLELRESQEIGCDSTVDSWKRQAVGTDAIEIEPEAGEDVEAQRYEFGINTIPEELQEIVAAEPVRADGGAEEWAAVCPEHGRIHLPTQPDEDVFESRQFCRRVAQAHVIDRHQDEPIDIEVRPAGGDRGAE
ncbi:hypothetical protein SAMN06269185_1080 [Natronoarchaeum philippinense]|uniref:Uncharacterized protein n=1 Tax=Natronoarchaeum philippinense TaxID=558529 RepID=A0A285NEW6_NATPI|nr:hypothetical protein [Natronoarchaeum philippinense]SNZ06191.1 hypothetical protein SAMN06269185_1080 [Natronoarchaeum philippinense]